MNQVWTCPKCNRVFSKKNQSHQCMKKDPGELFIGYPDEMVLAFDRLVTITADWEPQHYAATQNAIVFTSLKVWLVIRLLKSQLDLKLYLPETLDNDKIHKVQTYRGIHAHHIRISSEHDLDRQLIQILKTAHEYSINSAYE